MKKEHGFTLIELIIVIVILGILAIFAAPRFFDFSKDARISSLYGLKAALQGAAQIEYATSAIKSTTPNYPVASTAGIATAAGISTNDWIIAVHNGKVAFAPKSHNPPSFAASINPINDLKLCYLTYEVIPADPTATPPSLESFKIEVVDSAC